MRGGKNHIDDLTPYPQAKQQEEVFYFVFGVTTAFRNHKRKDGKSFRMPIAIISDLDIRALEYYDESSKDRKLPKVWLKSTLEPELEAISKEVDYEHMSTSFSSISEFESEIRTYKTEQFKPVGTTIERMKSVLSEDKKVPLDEEILTQIRKDKTIQIEKTTSVDTIKIFLPKAWTLEYEIANSGLYKLLATAINVAHYEKKYPEKEVTNKIIMELWEGINIRFPEGHLPTKDEAYEIFRPLNDGTVSKAITAQYLAGMITGEFPPVSNGVINKDTIKETFETDDNLKYLVNAIMHVKK